MGMMENQMDKKKEIEMDIGIMYRGPRDNFI